MRRFLLTAGLTGALLLAGPAAGLAADQDDETWRYDFRIEGLDDLMQDMDRFLRAIPRFEAPYIDENGDIIIRRAPPIEPEASPFQRPAEPEFADI